MKIHTAETKIEQLIKNATSISYCTEIERDNKIEAEIVFIPKNASASVVVTKDLFPINSILVSSVWNANDDVFVKEELWKARHTPVNHPVNMEHDQDEIVGHMTEVWAVDDHGNLIPEDTDEADLPSIFSLANKSIIYTHWFSEERLSRINQLIADINNNEMYVSMECIFDNFDYALSGKGEYTIIKRSEETAFLSEHLRCFGGRGIYNDYRIGRVLRNITFIGKGFTKDPANKRSVIFTNIPAPSEYKDGVQSVVAHIMENDNMPENVSQELQTQLAEIQSQLAILKAEKDTLLTELESVKSKASADLLALQSENEQLKTANANLENEYKTLVRKSELVQSGVPAEKADACVKLYVALNDAQWKPILEALSAGAKVVQTPNAPEAPETILATIKPEVTPATPNVNVDAESKKLEEISELQKSIASLLKVKMDGDNK